MRNEKTPLLLSLSLCATTLSFPNVSLILCCSINILTPLARAELAREEPGEDQVLGALG